jgi:hypothetical protein
MFLNYFDGLILCLELTALHWPHSIYTPSISQEQKDKYAQNPSL